MAGERRLNGDLRRFLVANFTDHNLVRVVTQNGTQTACKGQTFFLIYRDLYNAVKLIFDRVLDRYYLVFVVTDLVERRIKRCRLTGTGGPGYQDHSIRLLDIKPKPLNILRVKSNNIEIKILETLVDLLFVENTDNGVLAVNRRHDRNTEIDRAPLVTHAKTTILWEAPLADVEFRHALDSRDQRLMERDVDRIDLGVKRSVDA